MSCGTCSGAGLGKLNLNDFWKGFIMAVIGAALGVAYEVLQKGMPSNETAWKNLLVTAGGAALLAAVTYLLKNLGTGTGGQMLSNKPKEEVKDVPKS